MAFYLFKNPKEKRNDKFYGNINNNLTAPKITMAKNILNIILLFISIIVVGIPEGLPLSVTLSLAFSIKK